MLQAMQAIHVIIRDDSQLHVHKFQTQEKIKDLNCIDFSIPNLKLLACPSQGLPDICSYLLF